MKNQLCFSTSTLMCHSVLYGWYNKILYFVGGVCVLLLFLLFSSLYLCDMFDIVGKHIAYEKYDFIYCFPLIKCKKVKRECPQLSIL